MATGLSLSRKETTAILTLNRPEERNALGRDGDAAFFQEAAAEINGDPSLRAVLIRSEGRVFSAGGNLKEMRERTGAFEGDGPTLARAYERGVQNILKAVWSIDVPVIAAMQGSAIGLGLHLACACDFRIAAEGAKFSAPFLRLGIIPGDGGAWLLNRLIGPTRSAEIMYLSATIDAQTAVRWGLLNEVVHEGALDEAVGAHLKTLEAQPPQALRLAKKLLRESERSQLESLMTLSAGFQSLAQSTEDHEEALDAFFEKRDPVFKGR